MWCAVRFIGKGGRKREYVSGGCVPGSVSVCVVCNQTTVCDCEGERKRADFSYALLFFLFFLFLTFFFFPFPFASLYFKVFVTNIQVIGFTHYFNLLMHNF